MKQILFILCLLSTPSYGMSNSSNQYMKGAEIYSWEAPTGLIRYSLLSGTNRLKTKLEIESAGEELSAVLLKFSAIPKGTGIFIHSTPWPGADTGSLRWHKLSKAEWKKLKKAATTWGLDLEK